MLIDIVDSILALLMGTFLGVFYFMGLWWTVRQLGSSHYVALLFLSSMLFRTGIVIMGFYFILGDNWQRLVLGLLGFVLARVLAIRFIRRAEKSQTQDHKTSYAP